MPVNATFFLDPVTPLSLDHLGFFSHNRTRYQMVPVGGTREMSVSVQGGNVRVATTNRDVVRLGSTISDKPWPLSFQEFGSDDKTEHFFWLHGVGVGRALVVVEDFDGKRLDTLVVSVKRNIVKKYQLLRLQDIRRTTSRSPETLVAIMRNVSTLYLKQANVTLLQEHAPNVLYIAEDLGDPIDVKLTPDIFESWLAKRVSDELKGVGATRQDFTIVSTWNLADGADDKIAGVDPAFGTVMFCEDLKDEIAFINSCLFAHELAHAFKCSHRLDPPNLLMQLAIGSCQMSDIEIDRINPTGV
jgi:hypothetical protein